ncbi:MAG: CoA transferase [bacterium]
MLMLEGVRVLDFTRLLPGPFATLLLADMGADVIKIEDTGGGDYARYYPPMVGESSAFFESVNRNKRSITINLKSPDGVNLARKLAATADVIIESFRPGVMEKLGIGPVRLREEFPRLIYCSISGYGQTGTMADRAGHDINYMAHAGLLGQNGEFPTVPGFQVADLAGGALYAALGITSALYQRERKGVGAFLDISMTEGALSLALPLLAMHSAGGQTIPGGGMLTGGIAAYNVYQTKDGRALAVGSLEPKFWAGFLAEIGAPELIADGHGSPQAIARIAAIVSEHALEDWLARFGQVDVCVEGVKSLDEVLDSELHRSREVFFELSGVTQGRTPLTPLRQHTGAPALGEHTQTVVEELGLDFAGLRAANAI